MAEQWKHLSKTFTDQFANPVKLVENSGYLPMTVVFSWLISGFVWYKLGKFVYTSFLAHRMGQTTQWMPSTTSWAVITGATNGIGLEYANKFAGMGYSLLILDINEKRVSKTRDVLLKRNPNCQHIRTLSVDFKRADIYDKIRDEIGQLEHVDVLVNSVGMFTVENYFLEAENIEKSIQDMIYCNTLSLTQMINICLQRMVEQRRGIIINISSFLATAPTPLMAMNSATKIFVDYLSRALEIEYRDKGVVIQSVLPGLVGEELFDPQDILDKWDLKDSPIGQYMANITAHQFVNEAIKTVGVEKQTFGHWMHKWLLGFQGIFIQFFGDSLISNTLYHILKFKKSGYDWNDFAVKLIPLESKDDSDHSKLQ